MASRKEDPVEQGKRVTLVGLFVNVFLIALKLAAGIFGSSQALIADAVHSVSDLFTDAIVLIGLKIGRKDPDETHHFGHARIETLAYAVIGIALIGTAVYLGIKALWNIYLHVEYHPKIIAIFAALVSIGAKEGLYHYTIRTGRRINSPSIIANAWHHRSDALSSVAVLLGVLGAQIRPSWHILDAYAALLVSLLIIKVGIDIFKNAMNEFTDKAPDPETLERMCACIKDVDGVQGLHDVRVRTSGGMHQMEAHIVIDGTLTVVEGHRIANTVERRLLDEIPEINSVIIHVDPDLDEQ
ncbi:MAG: cation transporter [Deltaproteobacteria bacterium]|nr:cation transporter [Deltaproteobacteria bacterium]MBW2066798.1 cation transporter [Deltaproteobacteria bacterium]